MRFSDLDGRPALARSALGRTRPGRSDGSQKWRPVILALLALAAGCARAAPTAKDNECAWDALPDAQRGQLVSAYAKSGSGGLGRVRIDDSTIRAVAGRCGVRSADAAHLRTVSVAIAGAAMRHGSGQQLAPKGLTPDRLDAIWGKADADRNTLLALVEQGVRSDQDAKKLFAAVADLTRLSGGQVPASGDPMSDPGFRLYADYFTGRALEAQSSKDFAR